MPILASEPNIYPVNLLDLDDFNEFLPKDSSVAWWVLYTRSRQEKSLARDLLHREIRFYLPTVRRRLLIRGRAVHSHVPLLMGYLFVHCSHEDRVRADDRPRGAGAASAGFAAAAPRFAEYQTTDRQRRTTDSRSTAAGGSAGPHSVGSPPWTGGDRSQTQARDSPGCLDKDAAAGSFAGDR